MKAAVSQRVVGTLGSLNRYHHHGARFPRHGSMGKDSQGLNNRKHLHCSASITLPSVTTGPPLCSIEHCGNPQWTTTSSVHVHPPCNSLPYTVLIHLPYHYPTYCICP